MEIKPQEGLRLPRVDITAIADSKLMAHAWRTHLRPLARSQSLPGFFLAHDALENLGYEFNLSGITSLLAKELKAHRYRAGSPTFVRAAKGLGLTRPVAHLSFSDSLVYRSIVVQGQNSLAKATPPWARMGRRDASDTDMGGESGWFRAWLARQKKIWVMTETCDWLVESDIANYFPTIGIPQVCDYVRAQSNLSDESVRLLRHVLERLSPLVEYRTLASGGLAQEFSDSSRVIAHAYLSSLDHAFSTEGDAGRFTRWVDDIIVGADSWAEAHTVVKRIQLELEKLGLYPNAAKTRIYRRADFVWAYMKVENDFLGLIEEENPLPPAQRLEFNRRLSAHVQMPDPRPKGWARVMRRYYTNSRRLGDTYLLGYWTRHLSTSPESAAHILEYLRVFPLTTKTVRDLVWYSISSVASTRTLRYSPWSSWLLLLLAEIRRFDSG